MKETEDRVKTVAAERRQSLKELPTTLGLQPRSFQMVMSDPKKQISMTMLRELVDIGINANWLLTGKGAMIISDINSDNTEKLASQLKDANILIDSLERILKGK